MATIAQAEGVARALGIQREVLYAYVNEHNGMLPPPDQIVAALTVWGNQPSHNYPALGPRRWGDGSWHPQRPGGNCDDYCLEPMFQWPDPNYGPNGEPHAGVALAPAAGGGPAPIVRTVTGGASGGLSLGGNVQIPGIGAVPTIVVGAAAVGAVLMLSRRR